MEKSSTSFWAVFLLHLWACGFGAHPKLVFRRQHSLYMFKMTSKEKEAGKSPTPSKKKLKSGDSAGRLHVTNLCMKHEIFEKNILRPDFNWVESNVSELSMIVIIIIICTHLDHVYSKTDLSRHCPCFRSWKLFKLTLFIWTHRIGRIVGAKC